LYNNKRRKYKTGCAELPFAKVSVIMNLKWICCMDFLIVYHFVMCVNCLFVIQFLCNVPVFVFMYTNVNKRRKYKTGCAELPFAKVTFAVSILKECMIKGRNYHCLYSHKLSQNYIRSGKSCQMDIIFTMFLYFDLSKKM
jgi:hypothetical protein